jgi:hypothetical protein
VVESLDGKPHAGAVVGRRLNSPHPSAFERESPALRVAAAAVLSSMLGFEPHPSAGPTAQREGLEEGAGCMRMYDFGGAVVTISREASE